MRRLYGLLALAGLGLALAAPARADFTMAGNASGRTPLCDLHATATRVSVVVCGAGGWRLSTDRGATWRSLQPEGLTSISALGQSGDSLTAYGAGQDGAAFAALPAGAVEPEPAVSVFGPELYVSALGGVPDAQGGQRVVVRTQDGRTVLTATSSAGLVLRAEDLSLPLNATVREITPAADGGLWVEHDSGWLHVAPTGTQEVAPQGPTLADAGGGNQLRAGGLVLNGIPFPGTPVPQVPGAGTQVRPVAGAADLSVTSAGTLLRRAADDLITALWFQPPAGSTVVSDGTTLYAALVARPGRGVQTARDFNPDLFGAVWTSPLPGPAPEANGAVTPAGLEIIRAANVLRTEAGLPPLTADAKLSQAAENHSRYLALQAASSPFEQAGRAGFTGIDVRARCQAVGAECASESIDVVHGGRDAALGWMTAAYQRAPITDPLALLVGVAQAPGGPAVVDGTAGKGFLLRPRGFPNGTWSGPLEFSDGTPSPAQVCTFSSRQPHVKAPFGTAVSVSLPAGTLTGLQLRKVGATTPLVACLYHGTLIPEDPLDTATDYEATAQWTVGSTPMPAYTWRFHTTGTPAPPQGAAVRLASKARKRHGRWTLRLLAGHAKGRSATVRVRRLPGGRTSTRTLKLHAANTLRLPARGRRGWRITVEVAPFTTQRGVYAATRLTVTR